jgi:hypothetical protein
MAFYRQMANEIRRMEAAGKPDPAGIERISVRMNGFKFLIENAMEIERRSGASTNVLRPNNRKVRRALAAFNKEFLQGDRRSRRMFIRKVRRRYRPLTKEQIIGSMGSIRRSEGFKMIIVFPAGPDFGDGKSERARLAKEMAQAGQMVIVGTLNREKDDVEVVNKVQDNLYLMNQDLLSFLPHLATPEETMIYLSGPADMTVKDLLHPSKAIVETEDLSRYSATDPAGKTLVEQADVVVVRVRNENTPAIIGLQPNVVLLRNGEEAKAAQDILAILNDTKPPQKE